MLERSRPLRRSFIGLVVAGALAGALALILTPRALAGGGLDPSFGGDGRVTTAFTHGGFANAVAVQGDGRIVVAGCAGGEDSSGDIAVARYLPDGTLDPTFGDDGTVVTSIGTGFEEATAVALDDQGRIVVTGHDDEARFAVVRYLPDGTLDPAFGGDGIVTTGFTSGTDIAHGIVIQPDGRIVVAGQAGTREPRFAVARYRPDGTLDPAFGGGDGKALTRMGIWGVARAVALQSDGKIVLAGSQGFALVRYQRDGTLDRTFGGGDGKVMARLEAGLGMAFAHALAIRPDGKIVVGGFDAGEFRLAIARYRPDGRLDRTFGGDGWTFTSVARGTELANGLVLRPNGKTVVVGDISGHEYGDDVVPRMLVLRYTASGGLDRTFGTDGRVVTRFPGGVSAHGSARLPDGRIVVVGAAGPSPEFAVACYLR
jgi:uncharacterized delta-60 repeat protein